MKNLNTIILTFFLAFMFSCSQPVKKHDNSEVSLTSDTSNTDQLTKVANLNEDIMSEMTDPHEVNIDGYTFKYGYLEYDLEKYSFENPGFLKIYKDNKLVFSDAFNGEGSVDVESLGHHNLNGDKLVFRLNYGTQACDYVYTSKYYVIEKNQVKFLKKCYSLSGGDQGSSKFYKHIFPTDSAGQSNSILIVEGQIFYEKEQPNRLDTTFIKFADNTFKINKLTDNLSKVK